MYCSISKPNMKFSSGYLVFIFVTFISVVLCNTINYELRKNVRECKDISGVTENLLVALRDHKYLQNDPSSYCTLACVFKKQNEMNADNSVNIEGFSKLLERYGMSRDRTSTVAHICKAKIGTQADECQAAKSLVVCYNANFYQ